MKLSVIIPCYNSEKQIFSTIDSLEKQSYRNFEIIFVNDGSTDNTAYVIEEFMKNNHIKYKIINQRNKGVSVARNVGIDVAEGEYIYFLDSDDIVSENFFELCINKIEKLNLDAIFCGCDIINNDKVELFYNKKFKYVDGIIKGEEVIKYDLNQIYRIWTINIIFRLDIIKKNKIYYKENIKYGEDIDFIYRSLSKCEKVSSISKSMTFYIQRENSAMHIFSLERFTGLVAIRSTIDYFKSINSSTRLIENLENRFLKEIIYICNSYILYSYSDFYKYYIFYLLKIYKRNFKNFKIISKEDFKYYIFLKVLFYNIDLYKKIFLSIHTIKNKFN